MTTDARQPGDRPLWSKTAQAVGLSALVFVVLYLVRDPTDAIWGAPGAGLEWLGAFAQEGAPALGGARGTASQPEAEEPSPTEATTAPPVREAAVAALYDPGGKGLGHVRASLRRTMDRERGAMTRILHYGDSLMDTDFVSGSARRFMQERFGDGGHGFVNVAKPWAWYRHWDLFHSQRGTWNVNLVTHSVSADGRYGLGGATARPWGGSATIGTVPDGLVGTKVARFEVAYLEQPRGGTLELAVDDGQPQRVATAGPAVVPRWRQIAVPDGPHHLTIRAAGDGDVRTLGVVLERDSGVVWDTLGINGARIRILARFDAGHWAEQLRHRRPDLVILGFGLNESENPNYPVDDWPELPLVVERVRRAVPEASCLLVGPPDRVDREGGGHRSRPVIRRLTDEQREVALAHGCAFFDLQEAMGGDGAAARWARMRPRLVAGDLTHPTPEGAERIGRMLVEAITAGL